MKWHKLISIWVFLMLFMIPVTAYAVDFEISDVQIDVHLKADGNADVIEKHTYEFDSKFNGITREIFPKSGSSITRFEAYENGKPLKVEKEKELYKVHRSGKKEAVLFELHYQIINGVEKYEDGAQFYWPFFDKRNEAAYGDMKITVHPPDKATDVDYLGYDAAYEKGSLAAEGVVVFDLGEVPDGVNGDIRVIYEPSLFPNAEMKKGTVRDALKADERKIEEDRALFLAKQQDMKNVGSYTLPGFAAVLLGILLYIFMKRKGTKTAAQSLLEDHFVPTETLSMPATIYYTNPYGIGPELMSAALLDLIRKGYVKQVSEEAFELVDGSRTNEHEAALIDLLFSKVGNGNQFTIEGLKTYTENEENHEAYGNGLALWKNAVAKEVKDAGFKDKSVGLRWWTGLLSIAIIPIIVQLGRYEVYPSMAILIVLVLIGLSTALFYSPRNLQGFRVKEEWQRFRKRFEQASAAEWNELPVDDKYRGYIYGIGVKEGKLEQLYDEFKNAERRSERSSDTYSIYYNPIFMTQSFTMADTNAAVSTSSSSTSSSSGGGVGGGGGGSGAF